MKIENVAVGELKPHPKNYRNHPEDQLEHIVLSLQEHGFYRNVIITRDGTILAGHGVVQAAQKIGLETVPVIRLDLGPDDLKAMKILIGDNEISKLAEINDKLLADILSEIKDVDVSWLLGTGYNDQSLSILKMMTRPPAQALKMEEEGEWVGMPEYETGEHLPKLHVTFESQKDKADFLNLIGIKNLDPETTRSIWWPLKEKDDVKLVKFDEA